MTWRHKIGVAILVLLLAGAVFVLELAFLGGRERLEGYDVHSLLEY